ncbi:Uncharacterized protein YcnI [Alicyclobacillus macrosporangiidus]|uniref:Uncharacterized protein YcnI n=2 Tax=Alicyclobacillus macrosporangiidus TaxID=392015 RepID=A0A1I7K6X2_9BACL|nr:Uncharacterized protein YcnI [Alicyclobacillus macrosporangiidus]
MMFTKRMTVWSAAGALAATLVLGAPAVWAHVTVSPKTSTTGAWEKYTMRVPTEKDVPTVKVVLKVPDGVTFEQYEPVPGWTVSEDKDASGRVTRVTWTATGAGIAPGQFQEFSFVGQNPKQAGSVAWDAYQYYKDGSIVEWTGQPGADTPHSVTDILAAAPAGTQPAGTANTTGAPAAGTNTAAPAAPASGTAESRAPGWPGIVSVIALVLSVISLGTAWLSRRTNR